MAGEYNFTANTLIESSKVNDNFDGAYTGDFDETENSLRTFRDESLFNHVVSGGVITDPGASLTQTTTALVAVIDGRRITIGATAKTYTASRDTYVDVLRSGATAVYVYTEVANNSASPALASNSMRLAIVTTNGSEITNVNQGETTQVLPIASSLPYCVTDSLGNLIYPTDSTSSIIGYRQRITSFAPGTTAETLITGLSVPIIVTGSVKRKVEITVYSTYITSVSGINVFKLYDGVFGSGGTTIQASNSASNSGNHLSYLGTISPGSKTYTVTIENAAANPTVDGNAVYPIFIRVELR